MSASCEPLLEALKDCLMRSDCVLKKGKLPSECLRQHTDELPDACKSLRHAVFECKRGLVDMRKRFRGNQAAIMGKELQEKRKGGDGGGADPLGPHDAGR